jgi:hypothetical protein
MNQINLDALLRAPPASSGGASSPLKLHPDVHYQALLLQNSGNQGGDGQAQLQINTPHGIALISLDKAQATLLQTALQQTNASLGLTPSHSGQLKLTLSPTITVTVQIPPNINTATTSSASVTASQQPLQLQLTPQSNGEILLQPQAKMPSQLFLLSTAEVLQLLKPLATASASVASVANTPVSISLPVTLMRQENQIILTLNNQRQLQLPLKWLPTAAELPAQRPIAAQLMLHTVQGQLQIQLRLSEARTAMLSTASTSSALKTPPQTDSPSLQEANIGQASLNHRSKNLEANPSIKPTEPALDHTTTNKTFSTADIAAKSTTALARSAQAEMHNLTPAQSRQLLPTLVSATQAVNDPSVKSQLVNQNSPFQWQLIAPNKAGQDWQLQVSRRADSAVNANWHKNLVNEPMQASAPNTEQVKIAPLLIASTQVNRALQWQASTTAPNLSTKTDHRPLAVDVAPLWRQLLPLSQPKVDPLRADAELPPAVQAVLHEIRQHSLDSSKTLSGPLQLQQQLSAALQFNPQPQINPVVTPAAAATVALAIQLLLGRLSSQSSAENKATPNAKLQQLIGQLEPSQSSQLLRQLAGHASTMQGAQLATAEQLQQPNQPPQLFIQLPLLQQGESRFVELALTEREADGSQPGQKRTQWQLTMKFDLAKHGQMLVQVRLTGLQVSLQFYTEQQAPLALAQQFLPLFKDRLKMQGLDVTEAQCQLGKIPSQLYQRHHSLLAVKV